MFVLGFFVISNFLIVSLANTIKPDQVVDVFKSESLCQRLNDDLRLNLVWSQALFKTAEWHVADIHQSGAKLLGGGCTWKSWTAGSEHWNGCCNTGNFLDNAEDLKCETWKPRELTANWGKWAYTWQTTELFSNFTDPDEFVFWVDQQRTDVIWSRNRWADYQWEAIGCAVSNNFTSVWLGMGVDTLMPAYTRGGGFPLEGNDETRASLADIAPPSGPNVVLIIAVFGALLLCAVILCMGVAYARRDEGTTRVATFSDLYAASAKEVSPVAPDDDDIGGMGVLSHHRQSNNNNNNNNNMVRDSYSRAMFGAQRESEQERSGYSDISELSPPQMRLGADPDRNMNSATNLETQRNRNMYDEVYDERVSSLPSSNFGGPSEVRGYVGEGADGRSEWFNVANGGYDHVEGKNSPRPVY